MSPNVNDNPQGSVAYNLLEIYQRAIKDLSASAESLQPTERYVLLTPCVRMMWELATQLEILVEMPERNTLVLLKYAYAKKINAINGEIAKRGEPYTSRLDKYVDDLKKKQRWCENELKKHDSNPPKWTALEQG